MAILPPPEGTRAAPRLPDPCRAPVDWHLGSVDRRFGLSVGEVKQAVEEAAQVWETEAGRTLFRYTPGRGMVIALAYDGRQALHQELRRLDSEVVQRRSQYERTGVRREYAEATERYNQIVERLQGRHSAVLLTETGNDGVQLRVVNRELTVFTFGSYEELVHLLAHELGHSLGLGHLYTQEALMHESYRHHDVTYPPRLHKADLVALNRACGPFS